MLSSNGYSPNTQSGPIIDTDIHPLFDHDLVPNYLSQPWKRRFAEGNQGPGGFGFWNPHGLRRPDTLAPDRDGDTPGFAVRLLPDHLRNSLMRETAGKLYSLPTPQHAEAAYA